MNDIINLFTKDAKKLGRILALTIILGIAGSMSVQMINSAGDPQAVLSEWMRLAEIAVLFYFIKTTESKAIE